jgi:hypothetical protein
MISGKEFSLVLLSLEKRKKKVASEIHSYLNISSLEGIFLQALKVEYMRLARLIFIV